jgi:hypothetical protein
MSSTGTGYEWTTGGDSTLVHRKTIARGGSAVVHEVNSGLALLIP